MNKSHSTISIFMLFAQSFHAFSMNTDFTEKENNRDRLFEKTADYPLLTIPLEKGLYTFPDERSLTIVDNHGPRMFDLPSGKEKHYLKNRINRFYKEATFHAISPDGTKAIIRRKDSLAMIDLHNTWHQVPLKSGIVSFEKQKYLWDLISIEKPVFQSLIKAEISRNNQYSFIIYPTISYWSYGIGNRTLEIFDNTGKKLAFINSPRLNPIDSASFSPNSYFLYTVGWDGLKKINLASIIQNKKPSEAIDLTNKDALENLCAAKDSSLFIQDLLSKVPICNTVVAGNKYLALANITQNPDAFLCLIGLAKNNQIFKKKDPVLSVCFDPYEKYLIYLDFNEKFHCIGTSSISESYECSSVKSLIKPEYPKNPKNIKCSLTAVAFQYNKDLIFLPFFLGLSPENKKAILEKIQEKDVIEQK